MNIQRQWLQRVASALFLGLLLFVSVALLYSPRVIADDFATRQLRLSDSMASATNVQYELRFSGHPTVSVGSIRLQLCANDPFPGMPCTVPGGLDFTSAALVAQSGMTGFSIHPSTTANELVLTRTPAAGSGAVSIYELAGVHNPTNPGSYYGRLETFASTDASGIAEAANGLAIAITPSDVTIQTYVPPYLEFCLGNIIVGEDCGTASGNYIDFGELSPTRTSTGQTKLLVATNADYGYSIQVTGTTLTSGINVIPPMTSQDISRPGTSQFGMNLRANSTPSSGQDPIGMGRGAPTSDYNVPNRFKFLSGETVAGYNDPDYFETYTVNYIVNVASSQPPGIYVSTLTYIALATF